MRLVTLKVMAITGMITDLLDKEIHLKLMQPFHHTSMIEVDSILTLQ